MGVSKSGQVAVIGAGIVGVATAIWLQRAGHRVVLIDREGPAAGASAGNAGLLAASAVVPVPVPGLWRKAPAMALSPDQPLFVNWRRLPLLLPFLARYLAQARPDRVARISAALAPILRDSLAEHQALARGTPAARWIHGCDYLFLYRDRAGYAADRFAWDTRRALGYEWEMLEGAALAARDPAIGPGFACAARLGGHGRIADPARYVGDLAAHFRAAGGRILRAEVAAVLRDDKGRLRGLHAGGAVLECRRAVLCAGIDSGGLMADLGLSVPMQSERGYHLEFWAPSVMPRDPVMVTTGKFVATPMAGRLRLAGIVEYGGLGAKPASAPLALLRRQAAAAFPGLRAERVTEWCGHRPVVADSLPLIGPVPGVKGLYAGFGHQHVGLTAGAVTGRLLAQMISGQTPNRELSAYDPARFARRR